MNKDNPTVEILISEDELRDLIRGSEFKWTLPASDGQDINILVRLERWSDNDIEEDEEIIEDEAVI